MGIVINLDVMMARRKMSLNELAQRVERTTRAQVQAAAQKLTLDTVYFLKGKE